MNKVIMFCGPPASGKTTRSQELVEQGYTLFSPDRWLEETSAGNYNWTPARAKEAWATEIGRFKKHSEDTRFTAKGYPAIWDATFISIKARAPILKLAKEAGSIVEAWVMSTPKELCYLRNSEREEFRRVPEDVMDRMFLNFKSPTVEEGFDEIKVIKCGK